MGKTKTYNYDDLDFVGDYDFGEEPEPYISPKKEKKLKKVSDKQVGIQPRRQKNSKPMPFAASKPEEPISTKSIESTCNKCQSTIYGDMMGYIYQESSDTNAPIIRYTCKTCGHIGRRSVWNLALNSDEFDRLYF